MKPLPMTLLAALLGGCGAKHEPVKLIARPPAIEMSAAAVVPSAVTAAPAAPAPQASAAMPAAPPAAQLSRLPPPVALAAPARVHQDGMPTGNDQFRAAIDAKLRARAAAPP